MRNDQIHRYEQIGRARSWWSKHIFENSLERFVGCDTAMSPRLYRHQYSPYTVVAASGPAIGFCPREDSHTIWIHKRNYVGFGIAALAVVRNSMPNQLVDECEPILWRIHQQFEERPLCWRGWQKFMIDERKGFYTLVARAPMARSRLLNQPLFGQSGQFSRCCLCQGSAHRQDASDKIIVVLAACHRLKIFGCQIRCCACEREETASQSRLQGLHLVVPEVFPKFWPFTWFRQCTSRFHQPEPAIQLSCHGWCYGRQSV